MTTRSTYRFLPLALVPGVIACASGTSGPASDDREPASDAPTAEHALRLPMASVKPAPIASPEVYVVLDQPPVVEHVVRTGGLASPGAGARSREHFARLQEQHDRVRPRLEAVGEVVGELYRVGNAIQLRVDPAHVQALRALPEVLAVEPVPLHTRSLASALPVIGAPTAWGFAATGAGIRIGIIDSGIDYTHADFGGPGTVDAYNTNNDDVVEPGTFPTARVIGGHDFVGDEYDPGGGGSAAPDPDPLDCAQQQNFDVSGGHGTHVAGIAAGNGVLLDGTPFTGPYEQSLDLAAFRVPPGVAPEAQLFAFKIFGCNGGTTMLGVALDRAADPDQDGDTSDRLDVVNASLGTAYGLSSGLEAALIANLEAAGSVFVAAAGNEGQSYFAAASPGIYPHTLSVAASADSDFLAVQVLEPDPLAGEIPAAEGGFTTRLVVTGPITGAAVAAVPANACSGLSNASAVAGKILLVLRGDCLFVDKFENAEAAGATAVVVIDNEESAAPFAMGGGDPGESPLPGVMIGKTQGEALLDALPGVTLALDGTKKYRGLGSELFAPFSSRGPSVEGLRLKPDLAAPGFAIDSAQVASGTEPRRSDGTSMASPMVAGAVALVRQARPDLAPHDVRALLVNTAATVSNEAGNPYVVSIAGGGRIDVGRALGTNVTAAADALDGSIGLAFGAIVSSTPREVTRVARVTNHGTEPAVLSADAVQTYPLPGVQLVVEPPVLTIAPGEDATIAVTLRVDPMALGAPAPDPVTPPMQYEQPRHYIPEASGHLVLTPEGGGEAVRLPFHALVRATAEQQAVPFFTCDTEPPVEGPISVGIDGTSAHPSAAITALQLGVVEDPDSDEDDRDILAIGASSNVATAADFEELSAYIGVATDRDWITPAQGVWSPVVVLIDTDFDREEDYFIFAEALSREGPYADILTAQTYRVSTGAPVESKRFLNILPAATQDTQPFLNRVIVMPVFLYELNLDPGRASFAYAAALLRDNLASFEETTDWAIFDAERPVLDTAVGGSVVDGRPVYAAGAPVQVTVNRAFANGAPLPQLLLLHHTNGASPRHEVLDLEHKASGNLVVTATGPAAALRDEPAQFTIAVDNAGTDVATGVELVVQIAGGVLQGATTKLGSCTDTAPVTCVLGGVAPGAHQTVTIGVTPHDTSTAVEVHAELSLLQGCDQLAEDSVASISAPVTDVAPEVTSSLGPSGGCACGVASGESGGGSAVAAASLLGLALARRRLGARPARRRCAPVPW